MMCVIDSVRVSRLLILLSLSSFVFRRCWLQRGDTSWWLAEVHKHVTDRLILRTCKKETKLHVVESSRVESSRVESSRVESSCQVNSSQVESSRYESCQKFGASSRCYMQLQKRKWYRYQVSRRLPVPA
eukprot:scaffold120559_cov36-Attheya_sp.AAC.2